jgi:hypothetical protein
MEKGPGPTPPSIVGTKDAPIIHVDGVATIAFLHGNARIALVSENVIPGPGGVCPELVCVAHLRLTLPGVESLKDACEKILLMAQQPSGPAH